MGMAAFAAFVLLAAGVGVVGFQSRVLFDPGRPLCGLGLAVWTGSYLVLNFGYSMGLKARPILDVLMVAMGFVLRAMAGAAAIGVVISPWLVGALWLFSVYMVLEYGSKPALRGILQ